jgi:arylsulfatase A-like enzyme
MLTDDQSFRTIHALGNPHLKTPNIDRLVRSGMTFTNTWQMGGNNAAVCMPSRAMLMTGKTVFHLQNDGSILPENHATLPETFRRAGYDTFHTGKWHNDTKSFARSFSSADKIFFGGMSSHYNIPIHDFNPEGDYPPDKRYFVTDRHSTLLYSDAAINHLERIEDDKPFFMYVAFQSPHDPRQMPAEYREMYDPEDIPLPPNFLPAHPFDFGEVNHRDEKLERWPRTPEKIRRHIADYYGFITFTDMAIGRILDALQKSGRYDNTIIVFAADNGLAVGQHGLMGKQNPYEHSVHVPLVMSGSGIPADRQSDAMCRLSDVFPTLCGLAGLDIPASVEGESLVPVIRGTRDSIRDTQFFAFKNFQRAIKKGEMKLIEYCVFGEKHTQLFDHARDPWETKNLADEPAFRSTVRSLRGELQRLMREHGDKAVLEKNDWGVPPIASWKPGNWKDPNPDVYYDASWPGR